MRDLNAKVGKKGDSEIVGMYRIEYLNEKREKWVQWCTTNNQIITNNWIQKYPRHLWA